MRYVDLNKVHFSMAPVCLTLAQLQSMLIMMMLRKLRVIPGEFPSRKYNQSIINLCIYENKCTHILEFAEYTYDGGHKVLHNVGNCKLKVLLYNRDSCEYEIIVR